MHAAAPRGRLLRALALRLLLRAHAHDVGLEDDSCLVQVAATASAGASWKFPWAWPAPARPDPVGSFLSNDGRVCFEGPKRLLESAVLTKKLSPYSAVLNATYIRHGVQCANEGYNLTVGEDDCYPGLHVFKRSELSMLQYRVGKRMALDAYVQRYGLNNSIVELMAACTCHAGSKLRSMKAYECTNLETIPGSWVYHDPQSNKFACKEGQFESTTRAVMMLGRLQLSVPPHGDHVAPVPCQQLGYASQGQDSDPPQFGSFLSNDRLLCYDGPLNAVTEALALKKVTPQRFLFNAGVVRKGVRCKDWQYEHDLGEDNCFPSVRTYKLSELAMFAFRIQLTTALKIYQKMYSINETAMQFMNACTCHPRSHLYDESQWRCGNISSVPFSWVHPHPEGGGEKVCHQATFEAGTRAVMALKSWDLLPQALSGDLDVAPVPCSARSLSPLL